MFESESSDALSENAENVEDFNNQENFVRILEKYPVLLNKSQTCSIKTQKLHSMKSFCDDYKQETGKVLNEVQVKKKINNMKTDIKKKADLQKSGNKAIKLKKWEGMLLSLLNSDRNPTISCIPGTFLINIPRHSAVICLILLSRWLCGRSTESQRQITRA